MERLNRILRSIESLDPLWRQRAQDHLDKLTKPIGSLGRLEELAIQMVALQQTDKPHIDRKAVYVFAADHGVTEEGVSVYPRKVTRQMVLNFLTGGAAINVMARKTATKVFVVDAGVDGDFPNEPGLIHCKVRRGTHNMLQTAAMSEGEMEAAVQIGIGLADQASRQGFDMIAVGEMGIGNTTSASAIAAALTGMHPRDVTGAGSGLASQAVHHKATVVRNILQKHNLLPPAVPDPLYVLRCVGGLEIAAMVGMIAAAARLRLACVIDGFICTAAAIIVYALQPKIREYLVASHKSEERGHRILLEKMGLNPLLDLGMRLGEGTGAVLAFPIIEMAVKIYNEMSSFGSAGISGPENDT